MIQSRGLFYCFAFFAGSLVSSFVIKNATYCSIRLKGRVLSIKLIQHFKASVGQPHNSDTFTFLKGKKCIQEHHCRQNFREPETCNKCRIPGTRYITHSAEKFEQMPSTIKYETYKKVSSGMLSPAALVKARDNFVS